MANNRSQEFWLVVAMLGSLILLIVLVLIVPINSLIGVSSTNSTLSGTDVLEFRRTILSIIITAFGAWVGAGAAYFFGKENLKVASQSLLAMRESPKEILRQLKIRDLLPKPLTWIVKSSDEIGPIYDKLKSEPESWFITVKKDEKYTVINEEAVWRYLDYIQLEKDPTSDKPISYEDAKKKTIDDVLTYIDADDSLKELLKDIHVPTSLDKSALETYDEMVSNNKTIAIVIALESDEPTHYVELSDIKNILMEKLSLI